MYICMEIDKWDLFNLFPERVGEGLKNTMMEDVNSGMINLIYCKNNCKSTMYTNPEQQKNKN
jgi:hypothetical protein